MELSVALSKRALDALAQPMPEVQAGLEQVPEVARVAASDALERGETHYTDRPGILPLRQKVSSWLTDQCGVATKPNDVVITCGATEARFVALQRLFEPGERVLSLVDARLLAAAAVVRGLELVTGSDASPEGIKGLFLAHDTPKTLREQWLEEAASREWWVIYESPAGSKQETHPATMPGLGARTVSVGGIGEARGLAGARIGYLAAPEKSAPELRSFKQALTICTTNLSQWSALALWEEGL